jgi:hypothetical protein
MNCETCQLELEDLIYGELSSRRAQEVRAHLTDCSACRQHRLEFEREQEVFARYSERTQREPQPELWASIRERIHNEGASRSSSRSPNTGTGFWAWLRRPLVVKQLAGAAALVAVTVLVTVFLVSRRDRGAREIAASVSPSPSMTIPTVSASPTPGQLMAEEKTLPDSAKNSGTVIARTDVASRQPRQPRLTDQEMIRQQLQRTEREYVAAIRMLDHAIAGRKGSLDAEAYRQYEASLALIDDSIDKSRAALRSRSADPVAGQFLLAAYARKVELMQEIALQ